MYYFYNFSQQEDFSKSVQNNYYYNYYYSIGTATLVGFGFLNYR